MKYYVISGEASGDLHASNLIREIKKNDTQTVFRCWGGDLMQAQGAEIVKHIKDISFMGFAEVLMNLKTILNNLKFCKNDILQFNPDVLILVDYPGFNLRIAQFAHQKGIKVYYYISPQIWAWKQSRVHKIRKVVDKMLVILPFEKDFYKKFDVEVDFVGHPLLDAIEIYKQNETYKDFKARNSLNEKPIVALLPGSRKQEISRMLKKMLSIKNDFSDVQFVVAGAPSIDSDFYRQCIKDAQVHIVYDATYDLLMNSTAALVTSGTATLETALFEVPEVVCYTGSFISYQIAKRVIRVKYISLVNLIMDEKIVTELIQHDLNYDNLKSELNQILNNADKIHELKTAYRNLRLKLGHNGASAKTAEIIYKSLTAIN
ncbi:MAG: lipid-A-disaccharide synthase [Bacteroidota bacterium]